MNTATIPDAASPFGLIDYVVPFTMQSRADRGDGPTQLSFPSSWVRPAHTSRVTTPGWVPLRYKDRYVDAFVLPISHRMGLPPTEAVSLVQVVTRTLLRERPQGVLWVPVFAPATWFLREVRAAARADLQHLCDRIAITNGRLPRYGDFGFPPFGATMPTGPEEGEQPKLLELPYKQRVALLSLGRLRTAFTKEINAQVPVSYRWMCTLMQRLAAAGYVEHTTRHSYEAWALTYNGTVCVRRGWGVPTYTRFDAGTETSTAGARHQRVARLWPGWLRQALPDADIWAGWSEPAIAGFSLRPDALAWGTFEGRETCFWLEVESGRRTDADLQVRIPGRIEAVAGHFGDYAVVFAFLSRAGTLRGLLPALTDRYPHVALVLAEWKSVGHLPRPVLGRVRADRGLR